MSTDTNPLTAKLELVLDTLRRSSTKSFSSSQLSRTYHQEAALRAIFTSVLSNSLLEYDATVFFPSAVEVVVVANEQMDFSRAPIALQWAWMTALCKLPTLAKLKPRSVELAINELRKRIASDETDWGRACACGLVHSLARHLNPKGRHLVDQLSIISKNFDATLRHCLEGPVESFPLTMLMCCTALTDLPCHWAPHLNLTTGSSPAACIEISAMSLITTLFNCLPKRSLLTLRWACAEGLASLTACPGVWRALRPEAKAEIFKALLRILRLWRAKGSFEKDGIYADDMCTREYRAVDDLTTTMMMKIADNAVVFDEVLEKPLLLRHLIARLLYLLPPLEGLGQKEEPPLLDLRWGALALIGRFLACPECVPLPRHIPLAQIEKSDEGNGEAVLSSSVVEVNYQHIFSKGCSDIEQLRRLHAVLALSLERYLTAYHIECAAVKPLPSVAKLAHYFATQKVSEDGVIFASCCK